MNHPKRRIALLGSSGSIGQKTLKVAERFSDRLEVTALAVNQSVDFLVEAAKKFNVPRVACGDTSKVAEVQEALGPSVEVYGGADAMEMLAAHDDVDIVVNGIVGSAGLRASLSAAASGKTLALANKESLVLAGELLMAEASKHGATVLPVDSEHSGLFQALEGITLDHVSRLIITASGGPFRGKKRHELENVVPAEALNHPIWPMGRRITVDSSTLFNKGLEVIETYHLFKIPAERIEVWVHPQSVIHGVVETNDGSMLAQMAAPDMLLPVQYSLSYPERWDCDIRPADLPNWKQLEFFDVDHETFPCLGLAYDALKSGGIMPTALNGADEIAVEAFLREELPYLGIADVLQVVLGQIKNRPADSLSAVLEADREARQLALAAVKVHAS
ncbi:MAG: 1-deoxy-D-xylulose-5-phosphate reductoisomerase [Candidatus Eisenbacteria bacterium]|uniref:1-deoxy-D-xylulose 5-phosphate reductoisomerase n=1 Tax=Eiseniibacteriota bacterium TaxID=2212470 RepID=A0A7Y2E7T3_UNCEI|nr:1-deoxy-D-xylulose-5-phosphate reductoisomerase [Candidatus Eisenbacteria bacterium]